LPQYKPQDGKKSGGSELPTCLPALECLFCIAKRIFVGSNNNLVTKIAIADRFFTLDSD